MTLAMGIHKLDNSTVKFLSTAQCFPLRTIAMLALFISTLSGCVSNNAVFTSRLSNQAADCLAFYQKLDNTVFEHDVEDSGEMRIPGFPFLRANRFLASFRNETLSPQAYAQWLELLRQKDERARLLEFANLPVNAAAKIATQIQPGFSFQQYLQDCGQTLINATLSAGFSIKNKLATVTEIPDHYQIWKRVIGLYPIASLFAESALNDLHQELQQPFQQPLEQIPLSGQSVRYQPDEAPSLSKQAVAKMLTDAYQNPLQLPLLPPEQLTELFQQFAPVWEIDTRNDSDKIGLVTLDNAEQPTIDTSKPVVYTKHAYTRYRGDTLLQLVYQIWLPKREKTGWLDLYGGELDSVIWRVTLNRQGEPVAYDSVHACGCYYLLFPATGYGAIQDHHDSEAVLSPKTIDNDPFRQRLLLHLAARTHYLQQVSPAQTDYFGQRYRLQNYDDLRSLHSETGQHLNLFGPSGIIEVSYRTERFFLWPFGVDSPGAMRQWGSHAIAFTGRRHFDDAFLLEKLLSPIN